MASPTGKQSIRCNVRSCTYNSSDHSYCDLTSIQVSAVPGGGTGSPKDESMCSSYRCQGE